MFKFNINFDIKFFKELLNLFFQMKSNNQIEYLNKIFLESNYVVYKKYPAHRNILEYLYKSSLYEFSISDFLTLEDKNKNSLNMSKGKLKICIEDFEINKIIFFNKETEKFNLSAIAIEEIKTYIQKYGYSTIPVEVK